MTGEVSVEPATDFPERFAAGAVLQWRREQSERELTVASARPHGSRILVRFEGVEDAAAARVLAGGDLSVPEEDAVAAPEDFYYGHEVEGWRCEDRKGRALGTAQRLERTAGGPMLLVDTGRQEPVSIPFVRPIVVTVERAGRRIVLDPPDGLMEL
jgi:16S rRNA processing protein RimM